MTKLPEGIAVEAVPNEAGITCGCVQCRKTLTQGPWMIIVSTVEGEWFLGHFPTKICCDEEKKAIRFFDDRAGAEKVCHTITKRIIQHGIESLMLYECRHVFENTSQ